MISNFGFSISNFRCLISNFVFSIPLFRLYIFNLTSRAKNNCSLGIGEPNFKSEFIHAVE